MLGIFFIYFIGKKFYDLAIKFDQNKWLFGILGALFYYLGTFIGGICIGAFALIVNWEVDWDNSPLMSAIGLPFGIGTCYFTYYFLRKKWEKEFIVLETIEDIGKINEDE